MVRGEVNSHNFALPLSSSEGHSETMPMPLAQHQLSWVSRPKPMREVSFRIGESEFAFNPVVMLIAVALLWGVTGWTIGDPTAALDSLIAWRQAISLNFTWFFIGGKAIRFFFLIFVVYKFGHIKLGAKEDVPEYSGLCYFAVR